MLSVHIRTGAHRMLELELTEGDALDLFWLVELLQAYGELPLPEPERQIARSEAP
jgi:hypothetical protein